MTDPCLVALEAFGAQPTLAVALRVTAEESLHQAVVAADVPIELDDHNTLLYLLA